MFAKPYKHKSINTLKNSEKKHLAQRVQNEFALPSEERAKELVPVKSSCICMKVVLNSGDQVNVYSVDSVPLLIETAQGLLPTVCALWKVPDLVPMLNIHSPVFPKVQGGAPLYLPGVNLPAGGVGFPIFQIGKILAARTEDNAAACIVGRAAMSSADMLLRASGICLDTLHFFGDQLCKDIKFNKIDRPKLGPPKAPTDFTTVNLTADIQQVTLQPSQEQWPSLGKQEWPSVGKPEPSPATPSMPPPPPNEPRLIPEDIVENSKDVCENGNEDDSEDWSAELEEPIPSDMDSLLEWCLLSFLKLEGKTIELPLKTNLLYKNHLHLMCPPDRSIDVKKSSYKKLSKFLEAMQQEGLLEVRSVERGVDAVVALHALHPRARAHRAPPALRRRLAARAPAAPPAPGAYEPPRVRELLCVTALVQELFAPLKRGAALSGGEARAAVGAYVARRALSAPHARGAVTLDATLAKIVGKPAQEAVRWEELMSRVCGAMTPSTELSYADGTVKLNKTKLEPIRMQVATRSGNKKVTLVSNLEQFGFSLPALAHACQLGAAATCGVTRAPGARADQLMLQGDQTHFVAKLLIEKYGLPKKFVEGADKALNKKNK